MPRTVEKVGDSATLNGSGTASAPGAPGRPAAFWRSPPVGRPLSGWRSGSPAPLRLPAVFIGRFSGRLAGWPGDLGDVRRFLRNLTALTTLPAWGRRPPVDRRRPWRPTCPCPVQAVARCSRLDSLPEKLRTVRSSTVLLPRRPKASPRSHPLEDFTRTTASKNALRSPWGLRPLSATGAARSRREAPPRLWVVLKACEGTPGPPPSQRDNGCDIPRGESGGQPGSVPQAAAPGWPVPGSLSGRGDGPVLSRGWLLAHGVEHAVRCCR